VDSDADGETSTGSAQEIVKNPHAKNGTGAFLLIAIVAMAVGGAGYYIKIIRPKKEAEDMDDAEDDYGYDGEPDEDELEE
jgi:uncharacterized protein HemX